jgi:hypothetical protein
MKYLCLGYGDKAKMDALPKEELTKVLGQCVPHVEELSKCKGMIIREAISWDVTTLRSSKGKVAVTDGPFAETMAEAIRVASLHPSARMGEDLGWRIELRAVGEFKPD